jgi:hypothetical protein
VSDERIEVILVSVETTPTSVPETQRLKGALKVLLRRFGFRCVSVRKATAPTVPQAKERRIRDAI